MFEVTVESSFCAAHWLRDYEGACERLHGHNYRVEVTVSGHELGPSGMLVDFRELKGALSQVLGRLDHRCLNDDIDDFAEGQLNPTAENVARWAYERLGEALEEAGDGRLGIVHVRVWESDKTAATYAPD